ncbi:phosphomethylpyrimidine synthase [Methanobrevibacter cuticularis]|uniref:Phosphomethylpyrimidine synthase n=1 Tax=Methanobrevibacter cuticularis TaxID=47311 RepID=A0A166DN34_9EURY|nr:phosphomethylpyrimidine synthase [Methanobrevibacter cuticularis]KZX15776.1 phosphomethylpyrimidine synthase [Methanobrevibacter cuticularis]
MTQVEDAKKGHITEEAKKIAEQEKINIDKLIQRIAEGKIVIPKNIGRTTKPCGIGEGLSTKINANIGSSSKMEDIDIEIKKAKVCEEYGADALMDLSTGSKLKEFRKRIIENVDIPIGTVPIYEAGVEAQNRDGSVINMSEDDIFKAIENQAKEGVDFMTLHCGINKDVVEKLQKSNRMMGIVSRGGTFLSSWILHNERENPLYKNYDYILELAYEYDITLSLGDGLRPGCLSDATDVPQIQELVTLGTLVKRAQESNVQVMVEGPGHVPLDQIAANMKIEKTLCNGAPFYVLGPIVTDLAPGYDHITSAIGGAIAAHSGADFLCYVTPAEHLAIPSLEDVKEGIIASKIAAQSADVALGLPNAWKKEKAMATARKNFDWDRQFELAFDSEKPKKYRKSCPVEDDKMCSMCGEYCAIRIAENDFTKKN